MAKQNAIQDENKVAALIAHTGTAGTAETVRVVGDSTGAVKVWGTVATGASVSVGTIPEVTNIVGGTIGSVLGVGGVVQVSGTVATGGAGTQPVEVIKGTLQSSGTTTGVGTITNLGSVTNIGTLKGVDLVTRIGNIGTIESGTVTTSLALNTGTITTGSLADIAKVHDAGTVGSVIGIGTVSNIVTISGTVTGAGTVSNVGSLTNIGTLKGVDLVTRIGNIGTIESGTVTTTLALNTGTITTGSLANIAKIHDGGTVGSVIGIGTVSNIVTTSGTVTGAGTVTNVGSLTNIGTLKGVDLVTRIGNIGTIESGTVTTTLALNSGTITTGSLTNIATLHNGTVVVPSGTVTTGSLANIAYIHTIGTMPAISIGESTGGTLDIITRVGNLGTMELGSVVVTSLPSSGTLLNLATGTLAAVTTVTTVSNLTNGSVNILTGTIQSSGTTTGVGVVTSVTNLVGGTLTALALGTVKINPTPVGSSVLSTHALGTGGGTFFGTLVAPTGAGTSLYLSGLSVVARSGTVDCGIASNVAGTTGAGVYARGLFVPSGGIARDFTPAINLGTNGTLAYFIITAGTVDFTVNYWVAP